MPALGPERVLEKVKVRSGMSKGCSWPMLPESELRHGRVLPSGLDRAGVEVAGILCVPAQYRLRLLLLCLGII